MKNNGINLIRKKVETKETIKTEKDWYVLFNMLIVCLIFSLSIVLTLFRLNIKSDLDAKKEALATNINNNLNTNSKEAIRKNISSLEDKYEIYNEFKNQNIDVNAIHGELSTLFPDVKIDKFVVQPATSFISVDIRLKQNGYNNLPKFFSTISKNKKFAGAQISSINFLLDQEDPNNKNSTISSNLSNSDKFITQITLLVDKTALLQKSDS